VEWHTIPDAATAAAALQSGEVDWWEQPIPDLMPILRDHRELTVQVHDKSGSMAMIRFNQLNPPFDKPAVRRALMGGIVQSDFMLAAMGEDKSRWRDKVGFFLPGTALATDAGMDALTGPRSLDKVKKDLAAAGYKGEKIVMLVPTDFAVLNAMSEVAGDYFRKVGLNLDYQSLDWGTVLQRLASKQPIDKGGWSLFCNFVPGAITTSPPLHTYLRGIGAKGTFGWPESARHEALLDSFFSAATPAEQQKLARDMQLQAFQDVPYIPTGQMLQPAAYRKQVSGIPDGFPLFYNVRKA
jgi:peptide/nickel transport system substrate-binding protein